MGPACCRARRDRGVCAVATLGEDRTAVLGDDVRIVSSLGWLPWLGRPDDTAVQRHGRVWLGVGHTWGDATSLQVVAGPHLGSTLDSRRQHQYAVDRNGWSMGYRSVGLEVRGRARWASSRLATARGRGHTHLGDEPLQIVDAGFLGTGLRWRSP